MLGEGVQPRHRAGAHYVAGDQGHVAAGKLGMGRELGGDRGFFRRRWEPRAETPCICEIDGRGRYPASMAAASARVNVR